MDAVPSESSTMLRRQPELHPAASVGVKAILTPPRIIYIENQSRTKYAGWREDDVNAHTYAYLAASAASSASKAVSKAWTWLEEEPRPISARPVRERPVSEPTALAMFSTEPLARPPPSG